MLMRESVWMCPVCGGDLEWKDRSLCCGKKHCFDAARSGYVHLLPASRMHAKLPGDDPEMVRARRRFLQKDYYAHLRQALTDALHEALPGGGILLDAGCGEGYYTAGIRAALDLKAYGVDISKTAADLAARADKESQYAVGSVFHLPVRDGACDAVMSVFAPYCGEEFRRVLRPGGIFVMAIPAARHLWELKSAVYDRPYENEVKDYALEGFRFLRCIPAEKMLHLPSQEDIADLFAMTPYAYRTGAQEKERLAALETLDTRAEFEVLVYAREA